ncbi:hypothetical protein Psal006b_01917 [Piscirickettsia salmonis]|uniref:Isocitrate dehydrogenase n=1 Tax=Piscirickettsia salmonis TaxID=1238 RepID=A0A1L6TBA2_PISSA|nr:hypothetical protein [Piscirickettsia salmonis]AKP73690.2 hypothetical protein PSLF89_1885 [Piscirickettsia salmonis LF-89 = ATCC VR-1361]ALB22478.1 isocitrate dehydrogenase [Piscirickettsia salmonis]AMA42060.1 hypothetical protein AWJ11_06500 [Piscirickettsia salmonis]AOS34527.1 hypothetical protein AVM72_03660 [Piscirickettsia salmonis]APS59247.1 hypothetical protein AVI53_00585 [Piscirickettsia salmonis]
MDYNSTFTKVMRLYVGHRFFWKGDEISHEDVLSLSGNIIETLLRKVNLTYSFLFDSKISYSRKRLEGQSQESIHINSDKETAFILLLIVIDIMEEAVIKSGDDVYLDNYIK